MSFTNPMQLAALAAVLTALVATWRWFRPRWRRFTAKVEQLFESVNGRPAITDKATGRQLSAAVPSLGIRLETLEGAVRDRTELDGRLTAVETTVAEHGRVIGELQTGRLDLERVVTRLESTQAWRAVEAIASQPGDVAGQSLEDRDTEL